MAEKGGLLMTVEKPLFMNNATWFYFDETDFCYKLTDKAPAEAKKSYDDFYSQVYNGSKVGD